MDEVSVLRKRLDEAERKAKEAEAAISVAPVAAAAIENTAAAAVAAGEKRKERSTDETLSNSRGLKSASYYMHISQTEGMLRKRLRIVDDYVRVTSLAGACETRIPCLTIDAPGVRRALMEQHYEVSEQIIPPVCTCGRGDKCELGHANCYPRSRLISWANAPKWEGPGAETSKETPV